MKANFFSEKFSSHDQLFFPLQLLDSAARAPCLSKKEPFAILRDRKLFVLETFLRISHAANWTKRLLHALHTYIGTAQAFTALLTLCRAGYQISLW